MEHTTSLKKKALKWWNEMNFDKRDEICNRHPSEKYIDSLYLKEHPTLCQHCYSPKKLETGLCSICGKFPTTSQLKEHPTEAEVSKEEEVLQILTDELDKSGLRKYTCINGFGYSQIERDIVSKLTNWQKEKDRALIEELKSSLEYLLKCHDRDYMRCELKEALIGAKQAITKAEQHLNNQ